MTDVTVTPNFLIDAFAACVSARSATYFSAPITSGRRDLDLVRKIGKSSATIDEATVEDREAHAREVIAANGTHARAVVSRLRQNGGAVVIDPTAFPAIPGWTQQHWIQFWGAIIERYASQVVF